jgi:hypothetical protein
MFSIVRSAFAQGTLEATLLPYGPSGPPLLAYATFYTPDTNTSGFSFPVFFQVTVNSDQAVIDTGRIFGGGTAWPFDLGTPMIVNGSMFFSGSTGMATHQIDDMLAGRTELEIFDGIAFASYLRGPLLPVPEPGSTALLTVGLVVAFFKRRHLLRLNQIQRN